MVTEGDQVVVGDTVTDDHERRYSYEVLCRRHHRRGVTRAVARATLSDPLPFGEEPGDQEDGSDRLWDRSEI
jgi:thymidine kinase